MRRLAVTLAALAALVAGCTGQDGPEPAPPGVLAEVDVPGGPAALTHGNDPLPPRPRALAAQTPPEAAWPCEGDGADGRRVQMIYVHAGAGNLAAMRPTIEAWARQVEGIFLTSARVTGGERLVRFVTDAGCRLSIVDAALSASALASFDQMIAELRARGLTSDARAYHAFVESNAYCGIGTIYDDDRPAGNYNESYAQYSRSDRPCWSPQVVAHELVHNLGGVQNSAPNSTGGLHSRDEHDVMSYPDGAPRGQVFIACPDPIGEDRLDCNHDDYFSTAPTGYLATHWNVADSSALSRSAGPTTTVPPAPTTTSSTTIPPPPPTSSTTIGTGKTSTELVIPSRVAAGQAFVARADISGDCGPTGTVAFYVSGRLVSRQVLVDSTRSAAVTLTITSAVSRPTIRADYSGSPACAPSRDTARTRVG